MATKENAYPPEKRKKTVEKARTRIDLGMLQKMVEHRLIYLSGDDVRLVARNLITYILRNALDGGPINDRVMKEVYTTIKDILGDGIVIPDELLNEEFDE